MKDTDKAPAALAEGGAAEAAQHQTGAQAPKAVGKGRAAGGKRAAATRTRQAVAGSAGIGGEPDQVSALRDMAARQLALRIQAGELSAAELLKVLGLPAPQRAALPAPGPEGDYRIELSHDG